jgi:hypothetical protein
MRRRLKTFIPKDYRQKPAKSLILDILQKGRGGGILNPETRQTAHPLQNAQRMGHPEFMLAMRHPGRRSR